MAFDPSTLNSTLTDGAIGSVGTFVAATLETLGHYMQSDMIDVLQNGFASSLGMMLYIFAAIVAIVTIALGGNYKTGLYFFIGTPMFFWIINTRVPSMGVRWEFGQRKYDTRYVENARAEVLEEGMSSASAMAGSGFGTSTVPSAPAATSPGATRTIPPAKVAWLFQEWDSLVSNVVQEFIKLVNLVKGDSDLTFVNKMERYDMVNNLSISDPNLKLFTALGVVNKCGEYYALLRYKYDPSIPDLQKKNLDEQLKEKAGVVTLNTKDVPELEKWLVESGNRDKVKDILPEGATELNCTQIWQIAVRLVSENGETIINRLTASDLPPQLKPSKAKDKLIEKFGRTINTWNGEVQLSGEQKALYMTNEVAVRMLLRELSTSNPALAQMEFDKHPRVWRAMGRDIDEDTARSIRNITAKEEWQGKGDFLSAMLTMPYIQGMALYFLAMMFPFFAMALIVPGRHTAILLWMGLWVWIKSWDFGFAIVMLVDELFYALMPHGSPMDDKMAADPLIAIKTVLQVDPTYSVHTYYNIMATLIAAVPIVTGALVKKGGSEIMSVIQSGFTRFGGKIGGAMSSNQGSYIVQSKVASTDRDRLNAVRSSIKDAFMDPLVMLPLLSAIPGEDARKKWMSQWKKYQSEKVDGLKSEASAAEGALGKIEKQLKNSKLPASDRAVLERAASRSQARLDYYKNALTSEREKLNPKFIQSVAADVASGVAKVGLERMKHAAWAKYELNVKTADYLAGLSEVNQQNTVDAVEVRYASHNRIARADLELAAAQFKWMGEMMSLKAGDVFDRAILNMTNRPTEGEWGLLANSAGNLVGVGISGYRWLTDSSPAKPRGQLPAPLPSQENVLPTVKYTPPGGAP